MESKVASLIAEPKPLTGWKQDWLDQFHKTEEDHLNIEMLTALVVYNASTSLMYGNMCLEYNKSKMVTVRVNI